MQFKLYADGSVHSRHLGYIEPELPGGWACIITDDGGQSLGELHDSAMTPTIDRMELMAVMKGLNLIHACSPDPYNVVQIFSDSKYVLHVLLNELLPRFQSLFLEQSSFDHGLMENAHTLEHERDADIRQNLKNILSSNSVSFHKVNKSVAPKEHARCDRLAAKVRRQLATKLGLPVKDFSQI